MSEPEQTTAAFTSPSGMGEGSPRDESIFRALVEHSPDIVLTLSTAGIVQYASPSVQKLFGGVGAAAGGYALRDFVHPEDVEAVDTLPAAVSELRTGSVQRVLRMQASDGRWLHIETLSSDLAHDPRIAGILVHGRDVTERVRIEEKMNHEALHDPLTGLANRMMFRDRLVRALDAARPGQGVAVILLDLDNFKAVNDALGHDSGDEMLRVVSARLLSATRGSDTAARFGGDEFAILLTGVRGREDVHPVLERVQSGLRRPIQLLGRDVPGSGSLGVAISFGADRVETLLREADIAMYAAKAAGRGQAKFFEPQMQSVVLDRVQLEADLRHAIIEGALDLAYQPLVDLNTGRTYGVEALARWMHPLKGAIPPDRFIRVAEEGGMIGALGRWVLNEACKKGSEWQRLRPGETPLLMSVNVSGRQLIDERIVTDVADALRSSKIAPGTLVLEITESTLVQNTEMVLSRLFALKALGVQLAIDDFGTGFSSLAYLRSFPLDVLKIDRRFVEDLGMAGSSGALARVVLSLGNTLGLRTVAEGVETQYQLDELRALGCQFGQGYLFARPLNAAQAADHFRNLEPEGRRAATPA